VDTVVPHRNRLFDPKEQYLSNFSYGYRAPSGFKLRLASDFVKEKITNRGEVHITAFEGYAFDDYYRTTRSMSRLIMSDSIGKSGHWQMMNGYSYYRRLKNSYQKDLVTLSEGMLASSLQDTAVFSELSSRAMYNTMWRKIDLLVGYDVNFQNGRSKKIPGGTRDMGDYALFGTVALPMFNERVTVQGGLRAQHNTLYSSPVTPSLNLLMKPSERVQVRASYAKGFRAPTLKELYLVFVDINHHVMGNPDLKAEQSDHVQLSLSTQLLEKKSNYAQLLVTGYYNHMHNGIMLTPDYPDSATSLDYTYRNITEMRNAIGTLEFEGQQGNVHYKFGYSYAYTFEEKNQYSSFDAHEFTVNAQYYWMRPKVGISLFTKFTGAQPFLMGNIDGSASFSGRQPSYTMVDFSLEKKFYKNRVQVIAGVKNILDVQTLRATGVVSSTAHSGNGNINYLPRRVFTSINITLD
jgi:outer membrane receptor for ferrienterochelin and colicins